MTEKRYKKASKKRGNMFEEHVGGLMYTTPWIKTSKKKKRKKKK